MILLSNGKEYSGAFDLTNHFLNGELTFNEWDTLLEEILTITFTEAIEQEIRRKICEQETQVK